MEPMDPARVVRLTFANPVKGALQSRRVYPIALRWGRLSDCCPAAAHLAIRGEEWLLDAADIEKPGYPTKSFPLACCTCVEPDPQKAL